MSTSDHYKFFYKYLKSQPTTRDVEENKIVEMANTMVKFCLEEHEKKHPNNMDKLRETAIMELRRAERELFGSEGSLASAVDSDDDFAGPSSLFSDDSLFAMSSIDPVPSTSGPPKKKVTKGKKK